MSDRRRHIAADDVAAVWRVRRCSVTGGTSRIFERSSQKSTRKGFKSCWNMRSRCRNFNEQKLKDARCFLSRNTPQTPLGERHMASRRGVSFVPVGQNSGINLADIRGSSKILFLRLEDRLFSSNSTFATRFFPAFNCTE